MVLFRGLIMCFNGNIGIDLDFSFCWSNVRKIKCVSASLTSFFHRLVAAKSFLAYLKTFFTKHASPY